MYVPLCYYFSIVYAAVLISTKEAFLICVTQGFFIAIIFFFVFILCSCKNSAHGLLAVLCCSINKAVSFYASQFLTEITQTRRSQIIANIELGESSSK